MYIYLFHLAISSRSKRKIIEKRLQIICRSMLTIRHEALNIKRHVLRLLALKKNWDDDPFFIIFISFFMFYILFHYFSISFSEQGCTKSELSLPRKNWKGEPNLIFVRFPLGITRKMRGKLGERENLKKIRGKNGNARSRKFFWGRLKIAGIPCIALPALFPR